MASNVAATTETISVPITNIKALPVVGPIERPITAKHGLVNQTDPGIPSLYILKDVDLNGEPEPKADERFQLTYSGLAEGTTLVQVVFTKRIGKDLEFSGVR